MIGNEFVYFGTTFGRPSPDEPPFDEDDPMADLFATPEESREQIVELYRLSWAHSDATIEALSSAAAITTAGTCRVLTVT